VDILYDNIWSASRWRDWRYDK